MAVAAAPADLTIEFSTGRFDVVSVLPDEYNAGNRFYGKDVAEFLCFGLGAHGFEGDFLDEDWGWLVLASDPGGAHVEICVYHWADDTSPEGLWRLRVASYVMKSGWFFKRRQALANSAALEAALRDLFAGAEFRVSIFGVADDW